MYYNTNDIKIVDHFIATAITSGLISEQAVKEMLTVLENNLNPTEKTEWMTKQDIIDFFGIHEQTYYKWIDKKWLKPYGFGRKMRFKKSEVITMRKKRPYKKRAKNV